MPRIIPRLVNYLAQSAEQPKYSPFHRAKRPKSLKTEVPPCPSFRVADNPRSILLVPTNPITSSRAYIRRKSLPPAVHLPKRVTVAKGEYDRPREMTKEERSWKESPYLRMLSSPIRQCFFSERYLPSDFLVRLGVMRLPPSRMSKAANTLLVPDGLQHPKFIGRRSGVGAYVLCLREAISKMISDGKHNRYAPTHSRLADQIAHLLRLRVLQEFEVLADQLDCWPKSGGAQDSFRNLRRLTRKEWISIKTTGIIPYEGALAVIVLPPPNRNPVTGVRIKGSMSAEPPGNDDMPSTPKKEPFPISTFLLKEKQMEIISDEAVYDILPPAKVPYYNGIALFPNPSQRAALYALFCRILAIEGKRCKYRPLRPVNVATDRKTRVKGENKASHAFLLTINSTLMGSGDTAAVAVALWRARMFEGAGIENGNHWVVSSNLQ